jgi:hypothetical protein
MKPAERRGIEQELRDLLMVLNHHSDRREYDQALQLFTADASFVGGPNTWTGHEQLRKMFDDRPATMIARHLITNTVLTVKDEHNAEGISYYFAMISDPGPDPKFPLPLEPFSMGEWHDTFVRLPEGWRIKRHEVRRMFLRQSARN